MPGKAIPVKPNPKKMDKVGKASRMAYIDSLGRGGNKTKGADKTGNKFFPDFSKPKGNRRRTLNQINEMNKKAGY
jgi:hypothetical protein